jgi:SAM-dependent methyltransferase
MSGILHHVAGYGQLVPYLAEAFRVVRPGGAVIVLDPNMLFPTAPPMALIDLAAQRLKPGWRHHVPHECPLLPGKIHRGMRDVGFTDIHLLGTSYVHNKFPWFLAKALDRTTTSLAKKPFFRHFGYWIGCVAIKSA